MIIVRDSLLKPFEKNKAFKWHYSIADNKTAEERLFQTQTFGI